MTTMIYSGVALVTGYLFLYASDGILTTALVNAFPSFDPNWFSGFNAVLFTMTFACTSNHALFLRNAIRGIDYNTVEAARNMGAKPFKVLWKVVFPMLVTMFSTVMTFITVCAPCPAPTLATTSSTPRSCVLPARPRRTRPSAGARRAAVHHLRCSPSCCSPCSRLRAQGPLPLRLQDQGAAAKTEDHKSRLDIPSRTSMPMSSSSSTWHPRGDDRHFLIPDLRRHPHEEARPFQLTLINFFGTRTIETSPRAAPTRCAGSTPSVYSPTRRRSAASR